MLSCGLRLCQACLELVLSWELSDIHGLCPDELRTFLLRRLSVGPKVGLSSCLNLNGPSM